LKLGGPAEILIQPRTHEELSRVVRACYQQGVPLRVLGSGCNMLVRDEGVRGAVLRLGEPAFTQIRVEGDRVRAGTGTAVSALISQAARHSLAGFETLVGIPYGRRCPALQRRRPPRRHRPVRPASGGHGQ
jgi:UDP-N-acetylmuramate dehydrogenase